MNGAMKFALSLAPRERNLWLRAAWAVLEGIALVIAEFTVLVLASVFIPVGGIGKAWPVVLLVVLTPFLAWTWRVIKNFRKLLRELD